MSLSLDAKTSAAIQHYTDFYLATGVYDLSANKAGTLEIPSTFTGRSRLKLPSLTRLHRIRPKAAAGLAKSSKMKPLVTDSISQSSIKVQGTAKSSTLRVTTAPNQRV